MNTDKPLNDLPPGRYSMIVDKDGTVSCTLEVAEDCLLTNEQLGQLVTGFYNLKPQAPIDNIPIEVMKAMSDAALFGRGCVRVDSNGGVSHIADTFDGV